MMPKFALSMLVALAVCAPLQEAAAQESTLGGALFGGAAGAIVGGALGGGVFASKIAKSRTVTVAIEAMNFRKAVYVGDLVSVYGHLVRVGRTSITVHLEAWVVRRQELQSILVTDGNFTYVSIDDNGRPQPVSPDGVIST